MVIELLGTLGFQVAIEAMRAAKKSWDKSDSKWVLDFNSETDTVVNVGCCGSFLIGENDIALAQKLIRAGDDHAKAMRGIVTWISMTAKGHFFDQWDTYRIGKEPLGSTSTMHGENKSLEGDELEKERENNFGKYVYTRYYILSYQTWRHIYFARKSHRLPSWKKVIAFIETLPLANELIIVK